MSPKNLNIQTKLLQKYVAPTKANLIEAANKTIRDFEWNPAYRFIISSIVIKFGKPIQFILENMVTLLEIPSRAKIIHSVPVFCY